jgi:hypothetical protein
MTHPEFTFFVGEFIFKSKWDADPCPARKGRCER